MYPVAKAARARAVLNNSKFCLQGTIHDLTTLKASPEDVVRHALCPD
jgi:hypothetical protein